jgi:putative membrane protein
MSYGWHYQGMGRGWWDVMIVAMVAFSAVFVIGVFALLRDWGRGRGSSRPESSAPTAIEILKERFARGELTEEEYLRWLTLLKE